MVANSTGSYATPTARQLRNAVDVLVVGGGPAGLSAALALGRVYRSVYIFDSGKYRNDVSQHSHSIPMHDHENPAEIRRKMKGELQTKYKTVRFVDKTVASIHKANGVFELLDTDGVRWNGRKLILATGCTDILPSIPGYKESWGKGIFHCPFCDGFEQAQDGSLSIAVLLDKQASLRELDNFWFLHTTLRQFAQKMTLLTNGNTVPKSVESDSWSGEMVLQPRTIAKVEHTGVDNHMAVHYVDGGADTFDIMFHSPATQPSTKFHQDLGLDMDPDGVIQIASPAQETSVRGVFAAGDCAVQMKKVAVAIGSGVSAGFGAHYDILCDDY